MEKVINYKAVDGKVFSSERDCLAYEENLRNEVNFDVTAEIEITAKLTVNCFKVLNRKGIPSTEKELHEWILEEIEEEKSELINEDNWAYQVVDKAYDVEMKIFAYDCDITNDAGENVIYTNYENYEDD